jgi:hypothetical protein
LRILTKRHVIRVLNRMTKQKDRDKANIFRKHLQSLRLLTIKTFDQRFSRGSGEGLYLSNKLVEKCETSVRKKSENTTTVDKILIQIAFVLPPLSSINCGKIPLYSVTVREQIVAGNMKLGSWRNHFSTFLNNFKMTIRKVTLTATIVNEKKF